MSPIRNICAEIVLLMWGCDILSLYNRLFMIEGLYHKILVSVQAVIFFNSNAQKLSNVLLNILACDMKDAVCTRGVDHKRDRVKDFGIQKCGTKTYYACRIDRM